jgi:hypothetical protein
MKTTLIVTLAFTFLGTGAMAQKKEKDKVLVNKTYTVEITENNVKKAKTEADEISFKGEKLSSKFMTAQNKIPAAAYTVSVDSTSDPKTITFSSEGKNPDGDIVKWDGTVTGEDIEGTAVITNKKGKTIHDYSFTGALKAKPGKK